MTPLLRNLLQDLAEHGGVFDRYLRVVASGRVHHKETVLSGFARGLLTMDGKRVVLSDEGRAAAAELMRKTI